MTDAPAFHALLAPGPKRGMVDSMLFDLFCAWQDWRLCMWEVDGLFVFLATMHFAFRQRRLKRSKQSRSPLVDHGAVAAAAGRLLFVT